MEASDLMNPLLGQFFLYPMKTLKTFVERNIIPEDAVKKSPLMTQLLGIDDDNDIVFRDCAGNARFHHSIREISDLEVRLKQYTEQERAIIREIFEDIFAHKQFMGRSGAMYKYEGIGCIYWHQNAKFMLSLIESMPAMNENELTELKEAYYRLQAGFGFRKTPAQWGAFPLEPYSHTPYNMPAQQPGMTGQVKEDILTRFAELGVVFRDGVLCFRPALLRESEFLTESSVFHYIDVVGEVRTIDLSAGMLAFTVCQIPIVYRLGVREGIIVTTQDGEAHYNSLQLGENDSVHLFDRTNTIRRIDVTLALNSNGFS